VSSGRVHLSAF
jgi:hypothetical protein